MPLIHLLTTLSLLMGISQPPPIYQQMEYIMGSLCHIEVYGLPTPKLKSAVQSAFAEMRRLEQVMSDYRPDSELNQVTRQAHLKPVVLSSDLYQVLAMAQQIAVHSGGAFDITVGPLVKLWGFKQKSLSAHPPPTAHQIQAQLKLVGYRHIHLTAHPPTLKLQQPGIQLDLGGIGKGYAVDRAMATLQRAGIRQAMIDFNSNQAFIGAPPGQTQWQSAIKHPRHTAQVLAVLSIQDRSVSTSGDYEQFFTWQGQRYSHIIDPRNGYPIKQAVTATVVHASGMIADALSTSLLVISPLEARKLLAKYQPLQAYWMRNTGKQTRWESLL